MPFCLCDIETIGHPDAHQWLDPITKAPGNYKKADAIAAYIAEATAERDARLGLDIDCNRIVALGYQDIGKEAIVALCSNEFEEREQLKLFWASFNVNQTRLLTFNGARFDLPVLVMRSLYLQVSHPEIVIAPAWKTQHVDLWERLSLGGVRKDVKGLKFYAKRFGIPVYDDITGADVTRLVTENTPESWQKIHDHCLFDLDLTRALAERLGVLTPTGVTA